MCVWLETYVIALIVDIYIKCIFSSNQIIHKISFSLCFSASNSLIDKFETQNQRLNKILWTIWFDEKMRLIYIIYCRVQHKQGNQDSMNGGLIKL